MEKVKKSACINCGYVKPKPVKDLDKEKYCNLCDVKYSLKNAFEHKNNYLHKIKNDIIKRIRKLKGDNEQDKKKLDEFSKSLVPMFKK